MQGGGLIAEWETVAAGRPLRGGCRAGLDRRYATLDEREQEDAMEHDDANDAWWNREQTDEEIEAGVQRIIDECFGGVMPTAAQLLAAAQLALREQRQNAAQN